MPVTANQNAAFEQMNSTHFSKSFLKLLECPEHTVSLSFSCEAGGLLRCKALYWTGFVDEQATKEWEVQLPRDSTLFKLITGEIT